MADVNTNGLVGKHPTIPYNGISFSTAWPSLAANGKDLYFSSDREGGLGDSTSTSVILRLMVG